MDHDRSAVARDPSAGWPETPVIPPSGVAERPRQRSPLASRAAVLALAAAAGVNSGCGMPRMPEIPGVYRIDIQQGNAVDREMLDQIEIGMDRRKVRFILGTPLLVDPFHQDRWDYIYSFHTGSEPAARQRVSLHFVDDRLARIEDHLAPGTLPGVVSERTRTLVTVPQRRTREGFLDALVPDFLKRDDKPADPSAADDVPPAKEAPAPQLR